MPTANCYFDAPTSSTTGWTQEGVANFAASQASPDHTDRIVCLNSSSFTSSYLSALNYTAIPAGSIINSVTAHSLEGRDSAGNGQGKTQIELSGNTTNLTLHTYGANWTVREEAVSRPGGGSWAYADLASVRCRYVSNGDGDGGQVRIDETYLIIDYTPTGTTFIVFL